MKKRSNAFILLGLLLIAAALFLTGRNIVLDRQAAIKAQDALEQLLVAIPRVSLKPVVSTQPIPEAGEDYTPPQETEVPDFMLNPTMEMPVKNVDGLDYIGYLSIPPLSLELPIVSEWSYSALNIAPCRYYGSAYTDDMVIAGHNFSTHFAALQSLRQGDSLTFTDMDGNVFSYEVVLCEVLDADAVAEMTQSSFDLTLFSCTVGGQYRVAVRCNYASADMATASSKK